MKNKFLKSAIIIFLILSLIACGSKNEEVKKENSQAVENVEKENSQTDKNIEKQTVRYAVMKGPTGVGSVNLIENSKNDDSNFMIQETVVGAPDEIVASLVGGNLDMAVVPANLASVLFNKTEGKIKALATNNLGVLYIVEIGNEINSLEDLKSKTILSAGKGATPETVFNYIMEKNNLIEGEDWNFEFKTEATEVAQSLLSGQGEIALLPEPMVTNVIAKNENARIAIDLNDEWKKLNETPQITGVLVGRSEFLDSIDVDLFLEEYKNSVETAAENIEKTSELLEKYNIIKKEVALKSISNMNLYYMDREDLKNTMTEYLNILFEKNPKSVGGKVPGEEFFYIGK